MCGHHRVAEITCSYLQSLVLGFFDAFYFFFAVTLDYVLHTRDDSHGILVGIDALDAVHARPSDFLDISGDRTYLRHSSSSSKIVDLLDDILYYCNIFDFLHMDCIEQFHHNVGRGR